MNTELKSAVMATDKDAQYDNSAKRLIAHKIILARILVKTVEEFKGMDPIEVAALKRDFLISAPCRWSRD